jgi:hypothetical protein
MGFQGGFTAGVLNQCNFGLNGFAFEIKGPAGYTWVIGNVVRCSPTSQPLTVSLLGVAKGIPGGNINGDLFTVRLSVPPIPVRTTTQSPYTALITIGTLATSPTFSITQVQVPIDGTSTRVDSPAPVQVVFQPTATVQGQTVQNALVQGKATAFFVGLKVDDIANLPTTGPGVAVQVTFDNATVGSVFVNGTCSLPATTINCWNPDGTATAVVNPSNPAFMPTSAGAKTVTATVNPPGPNHMIEGDGSSNGKTSSPVSVNVKNTGQLELDYVTITGCISLPTTSCYGTLQDPSGNTTANASSAFISRTYPIADSGGLVNNVLSIGPLGSFIPGIGCSSPTCASFNNIPVLEDALAVETRAFISSGGAARPVGLVPISYFAYHSLPVNGVTFGGGTPYAVSLVSENTETTAAHELGHQFGINLNPATEEYFDSPCALLPGASGLCPGNPASGFWVNGPNGGVPIDADKGFCFMGAETFFDVPGLGKTWVDSLHYSALLNKLNTNPADPEVLLVSAIAGNDGSISLQGWYRNTQGFANTSQPGNFEVKVLDVNGSALSDTTVPVTLTAIVEPGGTVPASSVPVAVVVPFPVTAVAVAISFAGQPKATINITTKLLADALNSIPDTGFDKNPSQRRNALLNQVSALDSQLSVRAYNEALNKLRNDISTSLQNWLIDGYTVQSPLQYTKPQILSFVQELIQRLTNTTGSH